MNAGRRSALYAGGSARLAGVEYTISQDAESIRNDRCLVKTRPIQLSSSSGSTARLQSAWLMVRGTSTCAPSWGSGRTRMAQHVCLTPANACA